MKKNLIRDVPVPASVQLCTQLTLQVVRLAVAVSWVGEMLPCSRDGSQHCSVECNGGADPGSVSLA